MIAPVHVTVGLLSDTVPDAGVAPRVIGMTKIETTATNKQSSPARAYLNRMTVEIARVLVSLLNISESPFSFLNRVANLSGGARPFDYYRPSYSPPKKRTCFEPLRLPLKVLSQAECFLPG
jgi:hypothetical protein